MGAASSSQVGFSIAYSTKDVICRAKLLDKVGYVCGVALFIIGVLSLTGHLSGIVAGSCGIGLSLPLVLINLRRASQQADGGVFKAKPVLIIQALALTAVAILSALVVAGVLPKMCVGIAVFSQTGLALLLSCVFNCLPACCYGAKLGKAIGRNDVEEISNTMTEFRTNLSQLVS